MNQTTQIGEIPTDSKLIQTSPREEFPEYGLKTENVFFNNISTKFQAISKHGEFVTFMTKAYYPMPNGAVKKSMESLLEKIGAVPYIPSQSRYGWHKSGNNDGAIYNTALETQMSLSYLFPEKFDITGAGDFVETGINLLNSEDGVYGLSISPFVRRNSCDNRMFHLAHEKILGAEVVKMSQTQILMAAQKNIQNARHDLDTLGITRRHSKSLNLDYVTDAVTNIKKFSTKVINRYKEMYQLKLNQATAEKLARAMPMRVIDDLRWLDVSKKNGKVMITKDITEWDAFNDITKSLTYGKSAFSATLRAYKKLDSILVAAK